MLADHNFLICSNFNTATVKSADIGRKKSSRKQFVFYTDK